MVERKQPLQVGDVVKYRLKMYGETHIGVVVKLDYCYEHPMDFKKDSRVCEDVQVMRSLLSVCPYNASEYGCMHSGLRRLQ